MKFAGKHEQVSETRERGFLRFLEVRAVGFHQSSSFLGGKMSDITAFLENVKDLEKTIYTMLSIGDFTKCHGVEVQSNSNSSIKLKLCESHI